MNQRARKRRRSPAVADVCRTPRERRVRALALLLTVTEVAERLGCGRTFVYELISSGELETVKLGRLRRVPVAALDALVERLRARAGDD